jgi:transcriptional regulator with XRE-family HTH domain
MKTNADITTIRQTVADRLRTLRKAAGKTQEQLAEEAGVGPEHLSKIETARRLPSLETLISLAEALGVGPADLIGGASSAVGSERVVRIDAILSRLADDDADFIESEIIAWAARISKMRTEVDKR